MGFDGKVAVVTGGGSGIGAAIAHALHRAGARVAVADRDGAAAQRVAQQLGGAGLAVDVARASAVETLVSSVEAGLGPIDIFVSNAGIARGEPTHAASATDETWALMWDIHVMAHVRAARALLPGMIERGSGQFVQVISAAGLLNQMGDAAYSTTKHAALGFAEALAITHGDDGIGVTAVCPQYVATPMIGLETPDHPGVLTADAVAAATLDAMAEGRFLCLPHGQVADYAAFKGQDHDGWIRAMRKLRRKVLAEGGSFDLGEVHRHI